MNKTSLRLIAVMMALLIVLAGCEDKSQPIEASDLPSDSPSTDSLDSIFIFKGEISVENYPAISPAEFEKDLEKSHEDNVEYFFGDEQYFGKITSPEDAAKFAEQVWIAVYGEEQILQQRPYIVKYNKDYDLWILEGDDEYLKGGVGGVAYAIFSGKDGKLLEFWHTE